MEYFVGGIHVGNVLGSQSVFNQPIGNWDVSTSHKFQGCPMFSFGILHRLINHIGGWNVSMTVTDMNGMFWGDAGAFNQPIEGWDTSSVVSFNSMFWGATSFDKPIGNWDTKNVAKMNRVFNQAISFNQGRLENWDTGNVDASMTCRWDFLQLAMHGC